MSVSTVHGGLRSDDRAQSTVEFALLIPVVCMFALLICQVVVLARAEFRLLDTCRNAARLVIVDPGMSDVALLTATSSADAGITLDRSMSMRPGEIGRLTCTRTDPTDIPLVGPILPSVEQSESFAVLIEGPDGFVPTMTADR